MLSSLPSPMRVSLVTEYDDTVPEFYRTIPLCGSVASLADDLPLWSAENPVLLDFPTGSGKTSFVYDILLPDALSKGKNLLLVSNRVALSTQQKRRIMEITHNPALKLLSAEGIKRAEDLGSVRVITYHRLPALCNDAAAAEWISNLGYAVFDEAHFFTSDSVFNENTEYFLRLSCERFCRAIRIYLTGTSWDVLTPLAKAEEKYYRCNTHRPYFCFRPIREFYHYTIPPDYSNYSLHFFSKLSELLPQIKSNLSEKWIIFVDSKASGKDFCRTLGNDACDYLDSASKETETWASIVKDKKFDKQVLVTTAVLDNGVDIVDNAVRNIVIIADNRTAIVQMAGRKRLAPNERVNLWICDLSEKVLSNRRSNCKSCLDWFDKYERYAAAQKYDAFIEEIWRSGDQTLFKLFRYSKGIVYPNRLAQYVLKRRWLFFKQILDGKTSFRAEVESWFGIKSDGITAVEQLNLFCHQNCGIPLSDDSANHLRDLISYSCDEVGFKEPQMKRKNCLKGVALTNRLAKIGLPYYVEDSKKTLIIHAKEDNIQNG